MDSVSSLPPTSIGGKERGTISSQEDDQKLPIRVDTEILELQQQCEGDHCHKKSELISTRKHSSLPLLWMAHCSFLRTAVAKHFDLTGQKIRNLNSADHR
ncbi:hypothetical protein TNCV_2017401 [Trichonephila clavipes]|nr:hypothetical protein TNCV_2017401 [Trichonephila clavipes]